MYKAMAAAALGALAYMGGRQAGFNSAAEAITTPVPAVPARVERTPTALMLLAPIEPVSYPDGAVVSSIATGQRILN
jgi:hypothetical protein